MEPTYDAGDRARLLSALEATGRDIDAEQAATERTVVLLIAALFLVVCIGWFTWFNRLARRHRAVQKALTERQVVDAGERRLMALVHNSADVVLTLDGDSTATFVSPASQDVLGIPAAGLTGRRVVDLVAEEDRAAFVQLLTGTLRGERSLSIRMLHADGRVLVVEGTLNDLRDDTAVACWVLTLRDVTDRTRLQEELTHQAFHDSLTGLANRQLFRRPALHALQRRDGRGTGGPVRRPRRLQAGQRRARARRRRPAPGHRLRADPGRPGGPRHRRPPGR